MKNDVFSDLHRMIACGLPPAAIVALATIVLTNQPEIHIRTLAATSGLQMGEVEHVALTLRARHIASYKSGVIKVTSQNLLDLISRVAALRQQPDDNPAEEVVKKARKKPTAHV